MKPGAILMCFIYAANQPELVKRLLTRKITCFAMERSQAGQTAVVGGVRIIAPLNVPSLLSRDASTLYARNQYALLALMMKDSIIVIDWTDDVLAQTALTHDGRLCDAAVELPAAAAKPAAAKPVAGQAA